MYTLRRFASTVVLAAVAGSALYAQNVTSARSGTVHYMEGSVSIDGQTIESQRAKFNVLKDGSTLSTQQGRVEILLTPGVFLRVAENSSVKMLDSRLLSTRVEFLSGTAMVESDDPNISVQDPAVTIIYKDFEVQPVKYGLFELFSEPSQVKVFKGQANVAVAGNHVVVKEGHLMPFAATLVAEKFDVKEADDLFLWARERSGYLSAANVAAARSAGGMQSGLLSSGSFGGGNWFYSNSLGMYTYLPGGRNIYWSPFGYGFFSPYSIYSYYSPGEYYWYGGGGSRNGGTAAQPVNSATQISRFGIASNHPTLSSPLRSVGPTTRGGFEGRGSGLGTPDAAFNPASTRGVDLTGRGSFNTASSTPSYSAPVAAPAVSAPVASGGDRGAAVSAPRGR